MVLIKRHLWREITEELGVGTLIFFKVPLYHKLSLGPSQGWARYLHGVRHQPHMGDWDVGPPWRITFGHKGRHFPSLQHASHVLSCSFPALATIQGNNMSVLMHTSNKSERQWNSLQNPQRSEDATSQAIMQTVSQPNIPVGDPSMTWPM